MPEGCCRSACQWPTAGRASRELNTAYRAPMTATTRTNATAVSQAAGVHTLVRRFIKTGIAFLLAGILLGGWMVIRQATGMPNDEYDHDASKRRCVQAAANAHWHNMTSLPRRRRIGCLKPERGTILRHEGSSDTMLISFAPLCAHAVHADPTSGDGRAMACRPTGLCPPERFSRGWSANRGPRLTRVSALRLRIAGGAERVRMSRAATPTTTRQRGMGGRMLRSTA